MICLIMKDKLRDISKVADLGRIFISNDSIELIMFLEGSIVYTRSVQGMWCFKVLFV